MKVLNAVIVHLHLEHAMPESERQPFHEVFHDFEPYHWLRMPWSFRRRLCGQCSERFWWIW